MEAMKSKCIVRGILNYSSLYVIFIGIFFSVICVAILSRTCYAATDPIPLAGFNLTNANTNNYNLPTDWKARCTQDFDGATPINSNASWALGRCETGDIGTGWSVSTHMRQSTTTNIAYRGLYSGEVYINNQNDGAEWGAGFPAQTKAVYLSWYERRDAFPDAKGFYFDGGDFFISRFSAGSADVLLNFCCSDSPGEPARGNNHAYLYWQPESISHMPFLTNFGDVQTDFDGAWHQWEVYFRPNTQTNGTPNNDGELEILHDGNVWAKFENTNLNGELNLGNGIYVKIAGSTTVGLNLANATTEWGASNPTSCQYLEPYLLAHPEQAQCAGSPATEACYGCADQGLTFAQLNTICPGTAPSHGFYRNVDDIIMAYSTTSPSNVATNTPTVSAFTIPSSYGSLTVPINVFTATDTVGVTGYKLTESAMLPGAGDSGWSGTAQTVYTFVRQGLKTLYAWAKNLAGFISPSSSVSVSNVSVTGAASSYTVTFNGNTNTGGSTAVQTLTYNTPTALTANGFTKTGYTFAGWNTVANGSGTSYANGASYTIGAANVTLYAKWTLIGTYTIGGSISGLISGTVVLRNNGKDDLSRSANSTFNFVTATTTGATYNVTIYTQPTGQTCSITGGSGSGTVASANVTTVSVTCAANSYAFTAVPSLGTLTCNGGACASSYNYNTSLAMSATSVAGYTVALSSTGTANGCSSSGGSAGAPATCTITMPAGNTGITAAYSLISYTYTFNGNGATTPASPASVTQNYGTSISTPTSPAKTGSTFSSWSPAIPATMPVSGGTSVAQWSVNSYTVTFNGNGNTGGSTAAQSLVYNTPTALTANGFTRTGYLFAGWNTLANGTGTNYTNGASYTIGAAAVTLYAQWTTSSYTVTFDKNGGNTDANPTTKTAAYNNNVGTLPTAPTKTGSTFASWNTAANGSGTAFTAVTAVTANLTVYAQWTANTYTIGGTISGLTGTVILQNNGKNNLSIASTSNSFTFSTATTTGNPYLVTVQTQPTGQTCSVNSGSGTVSSANITTVSVTCADNTCASLSNAASYNAYPTCGAATCVSGYNLSGSGSGATCVAQSSGGGGGGGGSVTLVDTTAPGIPTNFSAISTSTIVILSWTNPTDSDFAGVKLYRKTGTSPTSQTDTLATPIYQGKNTNFTDTSSKLIGQLYYYSLYSYDTRPNYSQPRTISFALPLPNGTPSAIATTTTPITNNPTTSSINNNPASGTVTTLIGASSATVNSITSGEANQLIASPTFAPFTVAEKIIYAKITALSSAILSDAKKYIIADFIHYGTPTTLILGAGERGGSIASFQSAFARLPNSNLDWQDVVKIGNGRWTTQTSATAEARAKISFKKIYLREPNMKQANDNAAVNIMAYGLRPASRNTASEKIAILSFKYIFKKIPVSAEEWDIVRAIAYSGAKR